LLLVWVGHESLYIPNGREHWVSDLGPILDFHRTFGPSGVDYGRCVVSYSQEEEEAKVSDLGVENVHGMVEEDIKKL
jgi:hypothetical protein